MNHITEAMCVISLKETDTSSKIFLEQKQLSDQCLQPDSSAGIKPSQREFKFFTTIALRGGIKKIKIYPPSVKSRYLPVGKKGTLAVYAIKISSQAFRKESTRQVSKAILFLVSTWFWKGVAMLQHLE